MSFAYEQGLRGPRCNGCKYAQLKHELGDKFLELREQLDPLVMPEEDAYAKYMYLSDTAYNMGRPDIAHEHPVSVLEHVQ